MYRDVYYSVCPPKNMAKYVGGKVWLKGDGKRGWNDYFFPNSKKYSYFFPYWLYTPAAGPALFHLHTEKGLTICILLT